MNIPRIATFKVYMVMQQEIMPGRTLYNYVLLVLPRVHNYLLLVLQI